MNNLIHRIDETLNTGEKILISLLIGGLLIGLLVDYDTPPPEQNNNYNRLLNETSD